MYLRSLGYYMWVMVLILDHSEAASVKSGVYLRVERQ